MVNGRSVNPDSNSVMLGALLGTSQVSDGDRAVGRESYRAWTAGPASNPFWPFYCQPARQSASTGECDDLGCWYSRQGFRRCTEAVDGACILAHAQRAPL